MFYCYTSVVVYVLFCTLEDDFSANTASVESFFNG